MYNREWMDEMNCRAKTDDWYQALLEDVKAAEPAYLAIYNSLPESQQEQLGAYIAACEELEHSLTLIAYQLGLEHDK